MFESRVPCLIHEELMRCRADPSRIVQLNTRDHLDPDWEKPPLEWSRRTDANDPYTDVVITSQFQLLNEDTQSFFLPRQYEVILGIEALFDDTEGLELQIGTHINFPFEGKMVSVVLPLVAIGFQELSVRRQDMPFRPVAEMPFKITGCYLTTIHRRAISFDKIMCEHEFRAEKLCVFHHMVHTENDIGHGAMRFPCPSKYFDDDPKSDWFDKKFTWRYWYAMPYSPHLRDLARPFSRKIARSLVRKRQIMKRAAQWLR